MPRSAKQAALATMWTAVLFSSSVLASVHWGLAVGTIAMGATGTVAILFGVRTVPERASAVRRHVKSTYLIHPSRVVRVIRGTIPRVAP